FRLDKNKIIFLEINTNPGMTSTSLVPDMAKLKKISYEELVEKLVQGARCD
ncbi:MAG: D-alanine--D-alanine ligase, partial [Alphaproteobacteria bacterium]|nr:D-alanine--D-alanine ligase [Alphaproteobacteria bacterium]